MENKEEHNYLKDINSVLLSAYEVIERTERGERGLPSGFKELDELTGGFYPKELTVIAGQPGEGKSCLLQQIALNMARSGKKILLASYEVSQSEIGLNLLSNQTHINSLIFKTKKLLEKDKDKVNATITELSSLNFFVVDENTVTTDSLGLIMDQIKPDILFVDYLNIMPDMGRLENKNDAIGEIMRKLLGLSGKYNIPVLLVSAMNREAGKRSIKEFKLHDLRDSSSIEYNAHKVFFVWRSNEDIFIDIKKNRNGPSEVKIKLKFYPEYHLIEDAGK